MVYKPVPCSFHCSIRNPRVANEIASAAAEAGDAARNWEQKRGRRTSSRVATHVWVRQMNTYLSLHRYNQSELGMNGIMIAQAIVSAVGAAAVLITSGWSETSRVRSQVDERESRYKSWMGRAFKNISG